jgi:hypothetical protein
MMTSENITRKDTAMSRMPSFCAVAAWFGVSRRAAIPLALAGAVLWAVAGLALASCAPAAPAAHPVVHRVAGIPRGQYVRWFFLTHGETYGES